MQDEVTQAARDAAAKYYEHRHPADNTLPDLMREGKADGSITVQAFAKFEQSIRHQEEREEEEAHKIGISEGRQEMVREIDLATGGDGEFRWSTEPDRHCPCEEAMKARVIERFHQAERERKRVQSVVEATIVLHHLVDWLESDPKAIHDLKHELGPDGVARVLAALATRQPTPTQGSSHDQ